MMIVLAYDIDTTTSDGKRRIQKLAKICEANGTRVQDSVFEMLLDPKQLERLEQELSLQIDPSCDSVRLYRLGDRFQARIRVLGREKIHTAYGLLSI